MAEVTPLPNDPETLEWRAREQALFDSGEYKPVPWVDEPWYRETNPALFHYAHVSTADSSKLSYTETDAKGRADRQTRVKAGRYLKRFFPEIPDTVIQAWAQKFAGENEDLGSLQIAMTPDDIETVFENGPRSCMSGAEFSGSEHPCRAYGAGDLGVAYFGAIDDASARAVVYPAKKAFNTIYGDSARLEPVLLAAGYSQATSDQFDGARMLLIVNQNGAGYCAPYFDGSLGLKTDGAGFKLSRCGDYSMRTTNGVVGGVYCERCEDYTDGDSDDLFSVGDQSWCESCYSNYAIYCESCEEGSDSEGSQCIGDQTWCESCVSNHASFCVRCDAYETDENVQSVDGETWCDSCAEEATRCEHCEEGTAKDTETVDGETWCADCVKSDASQCEDCDKWTVDDSLQVYPGADGYDVERCEDCHDSRVSDIDAYTLGDARRDSTRVALLPAAASHGARTVDSMLSAQALLPAAASVRTGRVVRPYAVLRGFPYQWGMEAREARHRGVGHVVRPIHYLAGVVLGAADSAA